MLISAKTHVNFEDGEIFPEENDTIEPKGGLKNEY